MATDWLLVIDFPDERVSRSEYDHMHAWLTTEGEARQMLRVLDDRLGNGHHHEVVGPPAMCPRCGAWPQT